MIRSALAASVFISLAACATSPALDAGGSDPAAYALANHHPSLAPALARAASARGDTRLIGFIGFALVFPGADRQAADRLGYRIIDAGGDAFRDEQERLRADRAYRFAEAWNQTMLSLVD